MTSKFYYINFIDQHLSSVSNVEEMLHYLTSFPEIIDIYQAELTAALHLFSRYQINEFKYPQINELCINAQHLSRVLNGKTLPLWCTIEEQFLNFEDTPDLVNVGKELNQFDFIYTIDQPSKLAAALFMGFYRTYALVAIPYLRQMNAQVASSLEEMLAILAIEGCQTQLFWATHHWILEYQEEGFSELLAKKVRITTKN